MRYLLLFLLPVMSQAQKIEAEAYKTMSGIQTEKTSDSLGGLNVGWIEKGDWMDYRVNLRQTGLYRVNFRVASIAKSSFDINGIQVDIPNTGGYQNWQTVSADVYLYASDWVTSWDKPTPPDEIGPAEVKITALSSGWNLNWFELIKRPDPKPAEKEDSLWFIDVGRRTFHILYTDKTSSDTLKLPK